MKIKRITLFLLVAILVVGCATPAAVKQLSNEIVEINQSYHESLATYFSIIETFVDAQVQLAESLLDESDEKINASYRELAKMELEEENPDIDAILDEFENSVNENATETQDYKAQLTDLSAQLKLKNAELLRIQSSIIEAQKKLNEYVQLEKADEVIVNELLGVVGIEMGKLTNTVGSISDIYKKISGIGESIIK